jgi:hypothetical protein
MVKIVRNAQTQIEEDPTVCDNIRYIIAGIIVSIAIVVVNLS